MGTGIEDPREGRRSGLHGGFVNLVLSVNETACRIKIFSDKESVWTLTQECRCSVRSKRRAALSTA